MPPLLLVTLLVAALVALIPVWRLRVAGWRPGWLFAAWLVYAIGIVVAIRLPVASRALLPILVLAYVAPFVAGPARLTRVFGVRPAPPNPVINVTPRPPAGLPEPEASDGEGEGDDDGDPDDRAASRDER
jgi:hypothetical protein